MSDKPDAHFGPRRRGLPPRDLEEKPVSLRLRNGQRARIKRKTKAGETFADTMRRLLDEAAGDE